MQAELSGGRHVTTTSTTSITSITSATSTATTRGLECCYHGSAKTEFIDHLRVKIVGFVAHSLTVMDVRKQPQTKASESAESYGRTYRAVYVLEI